MEFSAKHKHKIVYPNLDSGRTPAKHCETLPIPILPDDRLDLSQLTWKVMKMQLPFPDHLQIQRRYTFEGRNLEPKKFIEEQLNDLVRDLSCQKRKQSFSPQD